MFHQGEDNFCSLQLVGYIVIEPCIDQLLYPLCHLSFLDMHIKVKYVAIGF